MIDYSLTLSNYASLMDLLIKEGILTISALRSSKYFDDYCKFSFELASSVIGIKYQNIEHIKYRNGFDRDDWIQELAIKLSENYETTIKAVLRTAADNKKHSYGAYTFSVCSNMINDVLAGLNNFYIKEKKLEIDPKTGKECYRTVFVYEEDENGIMHKAKYPVTSSLDAGICNNDQDCDSFLDTLLGSDQSAEDQYAQNKLNDESLGNISEYVILFGKHSKKGRLLAFMETTLFELGYLSSRSFPDLICKSNNDHNTNIVSLYNTALDYMSAVLHVPDDHFCDLKACSSAEFEERLLSSSLFTVKDEFSKLRNRNKTELKKYLTLNRRLI